MTSEQRLRDALRHEAETLVPPDTSWDAVAAVIAARRRARRLRSALIAGSAAAAVAVIALAVTSGTGSHDRLRVVPPASSPTTAAPVETTTPQPTTTVARQDGVPEHIVASRGNGEVVLLRSNDGAVVRVLLPPGPDGAPRDVTLTPDGTAAYTESSFGPGCGTIHRVSTGGGPAEEIARGMSPTVSPDGKQLAYITHEPAAGAEDQGCRHMRLVVRDLVTGRERFATIYDPSVGDSMIQDVLLGTTWSPDSRHVAVKSGWENWASILIFDVATQESMRSHTQVPPEGGRTYWNPLYRGTIGDLVVYAEPPGSTLPEPIRGRYAVVDPRTGRIKSSYGENVRPVAFDASGEHMLSIDRGDVLTRWTGGRSVALGEGFVDADW